jgi:arylsulfatase
MSASPTGQQTGANRPPNILVLMTDQERHQDRLPALPTPVREWIDKNGTRVDRFHSSSMACSPSRATYWTGMYAPQQGIYGTFLVGNQFTMDPSLPTIGDLMKELGYQTAFFGKWHLSYFAASEPPTNLESLEDLIKLNPLEQYGFDHSMISPPSDSSAYNDGFVNDPVWTEQALSFLHEHAADEKPWFCVLSLLNPHDIQFYPKYYQAGFKAPDYEPQLEPSFAAEPNLDDKPYAQQLFRDVIEFISGESDTDINSPAYWRALLNTYYDLIVRTDDMLGAAVKAVVDAGVLDRTVIVRTSDHGELGGAHRLQGKGTTMYDEQNRVPLVFVYPKRFARGARSLALGEAVDFAPTLLEIAGEPEPVKRWPWLRGVSLVPALENPGGMGPRDHILYRTDELDVAHADGIQTLAPAHVRALFDGRYKIARYVAIKNNQFAGEEIASTQELEVYDTYEDPYEIRNLARDPAYAKLTHDLLMWLYENERVKWAAIDIPAFGPRPQLKSLPSVPYTGLSSKGPPWGEADEIFQPGGYLDVPVQEPQPLAFLYDGDPPTDLDPCLMQAAAGLGSYFSTLTPQRTAGRIRLIAPPGYILDPRAQG